MIDVPELSDFEIVVGIVSPIGTDLDRATEILAGQLEAYAYTSHVVRLSRLLDKSPVGAALPADSSVSDYYSDRMSAGDDLRKRLGGDALAGVAISHLLDLRTKEKKSLRRRHAWVLRTIKHEDEVKLLRATYGKRFLLLGMSAPEETRRSRLKAELQDADPGAKSLDAQVASLLERDQIDTENPFGQNVRDAYALSDYFIEVESTDALEEEVKRFLGLIFGEPFITPRRDEEGMFLAHAASLRSSDPGRQVGAVVSTEDGDVVSIGTNEVPKPGGGEYWSGDADDHRDFQMGFDYNKRATRRAIREFLDVLASSGHLEPAIAELPSDRRLDQILDQDPDGALKSSRIGSLIEFGRVVHAEMSAITRAARLGRDLTGGVLFTTAYPCHMCMRLIIASGIRRVVFVDPYPKSLAPEMYATEISTSGQEHSKVSVTPYRGASWSIYGSVFSAVNRSRHDDGSFKTFSKKTARMRLGEADPLGSAVELERQVPVALMRRRRRTEADEPNVGALRHSESNRSGGDGDPDGR